MKTYLLQNRSKPLGAYTSIKMLLERAAEELQVSVEHVEVYLPQKGGRMGSAQVETLRSLFWNGTTGSKVFLKEPGGKYKLRVTLLIINHSV